jgi:hypothetical protein
VPECEPPRGEQLLGAGRPHAGLERRRPGHLVELDEPVQPAQVERDPGPAGWRRPDTADHRRAAAERHDGDPLLGADPQHRDDLVVAARVDDRVRCAGRVTGALANQVGG